MDADTVRNGKVRTRPRSPITEPAPKYGPTAIYGSCEADGCMRDARETCSECHAEVCLSHAHHETHA